MCGIIYLKRNDGMSPVKPLLRRYEEQKTRGQEGYGFVAVKDGKVIGYERAKHFEEIEEQLQKFHEADEIMFHHRMPTSTPNLASCAHPIHVKNKLLKHEYYLIHNGVIHNEDTLKGEHELLGFEYETEVEEVVYWQPKKKKKNKHKHLENYSTTVVKFNDSESLAIEFALFNEGFKDTIGTTGSAAFVCYEVDPKTKMIVAVHYARNTGSPLKMARAHGITVIASQVSDKDAFEIETGKVYTMNMETKKFEVRNLTGFTMYSTSVKESGYSYPGYITSGTRSKKYCRMQQCLEDTIIGEDYCNRHKNHAVAHAMGFKTNEERGLIGNDDEPDDVERAIYGYVPLLPAGKKDIPAASTDDWSCVSWKDDICHNCEHDKEFIDRNQLSLFSKDAYGVLICNVCGTNGRFCIHAGVLRRDKDDTISTEDSSSVSGDDLKVAIIAQRKEDELDKLRTELKQYEEVCGMSRNESELMEWQLECTNLRAIIRRKEEELERYVMTHDIPF